jgi:tight adherence protein B
MMGDELPQPIGAEFRRCYGQHSLGQSLEESLRDMAGRIDSSDFAFFVTAVLIQRQTGGDLAEVLTNISTMIRARMRLKGHVKAITAEGRLTGNVLVAFPIVLFAISYTLNPNYAGVLLNTSVGKTLLCVAGALQLLGLFIIRKIVAVKEDLVTIETMPDKVRLIFTKGAIASVENSDIEENTLEKK